MKKRRIKILPRFWVFVAVFVLLLSCLWANIQLSAEKPKTGVCVASADVVTGAEVEKDYFLDIPLSYKQQEELYYASKEFGVDYYVMVALIEKETDFRNVMGDNGNSYGYCQIQPRWWYGLMSEIGATDLLIPEDNFRTACAIMHQLLEKYGSTEGALVAYNRGSYGGYSTSYSRDVIANAEKYRA